MTTRDTEGCPHCGSKRLSSELRDSKSNDPRTFGAWIVCRDCRKEWPDTTEDELEALVLKHRGLLNYLRLR